MHPLVRFRSSLKISPVGWGPNLKPNRYIVSAPVTHPEPTENCLVWFAGVGGDRVLNVGVNEE